MTPVVVRAGSVEDADMVMTIMTAAFDPRFGEAWSASQLMGVLAMPGAALFIAYRKRRPLGFALSHHVADEAELMLLAVDPQARRLGVATALLRHVTDSAVNAGARTLHLEVRRDNSASALYIGAGFEQCGVRSRYYRGVDGELFDAVTYRRSLI